MTARVLYLMLLGLLALAACAPAPTTPAPTLAVLPDTATPVPPSPTPTPTLAETVAALAPTASPLAPATLTPTPVPPSSTVTFTPAPSDTPTATQAPPTLTTEPSVTPSLTITKTITPTPSQTLTPTLDAGQFSSLLDMAARVTVLPPDVRYGPGTATALWEIGNQYAATALAAQPTAAPASTQGPGVVVIGVGTVGPAPNTTPVACAALPGGALGALLAGDPAFAAQLGCPLSSPTAVQGAFQPFERGIMMYRAASVPGMAGNIEALSADGRFSRAVDSWISGIDPESYGLAAPPGLVAPIRGFGKVWISDSALGARLGWATAAEQGVSLTAQLFERGIALYVPAQNLIYVLAEDMPGALAGSWRQVSGSF